MINRAAVYHFNEANADLARASMRSCKKHMPSLPIVQMALSGTLPVPEADNVVWMEARDEFPDVLFKSYAEMHLYVREVLMLHSDVIVLRDLTGLFEGEFDVALPVREPKEMMGAYPQVRLQSGIVAVSRCHEFWVEWYYGGHLPEDWENGKFDVAFHAWLAGTTYKVKELEGVIYTPDRNKHADWQGYGALHYENRHRKEMMRKLWT